jgi:exodeoxyribonuclease VII small subunit
MPRKSTDKSKSLEPAPGQMRYEQAVEELESIIERIEKGEIGLEESLTAYKRGSSLIKRCREILDSAEQQVEQLTEAMEREAAGGSDRKLSD